MKKILFISGIGGDTRRYRCLHPQEQLALKRAVTALREADDAQILADVFDYDLFILHRVPHSPLISLFVELARAQGKPLVFETDDLVFDPDLQAHIGYIDTLSPEAARRFRSDLRRLDQTLQGCDCALTTTQFLADEAGRRGKPAYVHRNAPSAEMFRLSEQAWAERGRRLEEENDPPRPLVIAYFSGTDSHNRDFQTIAGPLTEVLSAHPHTWLHVGGYLELGPDFEPFQSRIRRTPFVTWRELPQLIAQTDVNLAPLELDNPFCQAKSEIKFVEAALVGVPTVASRVEAYEHAITHERDGLLAGPPDEWRAALQSLLEHPDRRRELGQAARQTAYARYTPERRADELWATLHQIQQKFSRPPVDQDELEQLFRAGVRRYAGEIQQRVQEQEKQINGLRQSLRHYEQQLAVAERRHTQLGEQIAGRDEVIAERDRNISLLEQHLEAIRQGRVMRLMAWIQRQLRRQNH